MTLSRFVLAILLLAMASLACAITLPVITPTPTAATMPLFDSQTPLGATQTPIPVCYVVTAIKTLNLRNAPSVDATADPDGLTSGQRVEVIGQSGDWYQVQVGTRKGWARREYIGVC